VPVIASTNSAGEDVIRDGVNGFLVPIRQPDVIRGRLERLYGHPEELQRMKEDAAKDIRRKSLAWSDYGDRYADHIRRLTGSGTAVGQTGMAVHSGK
jgi:glycosyltransferase involved in cell wall biosynthesis